MGSHPGVLVLCPECEVSELFLGGRVCVSCCKASALVGALCVKWGSVRALRDRKAQEVRASGCHGV